MPVCTLQVIIAESKKGRRNQAYAAVMAACEKAGHWQLAVNMFKQVCRCSLTHRQHVYTLVTSTAPVPPLLFWMTGGAVQSLDIIARVQVKQSADLLISVGIDCYTIWQHQYLSVLLSRAQGCGTFGVAFRVHMSGLVDSILND
jgi:hypothetical protein